MMNQDFQAPEDFISLVTPPQQQVEPAWWFVFRGSHLLVESHDGQSTVPCCLEPSAFGMEPLRRQYLGTLDGRHCYSSESRADADPPPGMAWHGLRALFGQLDDRLFALAGRAVQIVDWDRSHQFCGGCGTPTVPRMHERARECPKCAQVSYPRIAPAVMVLVRRGSQLLLARSPHFMKGMYSALAGFVEPGESLEQTLVREVREEVGVHVRNVRYFSSQPWPFPHSLMIAFIADYAGGELKPDKGEIEDAGWFDLSNLPLLPGKISIARRLIDAVIAQIELGM